MQSQHLLQQQQYLAKQFPDKEEDKKGGGRERETCLERDRENAREREREPHLRTKNKAYE